MFLTTDSGHYTTIPLRITRFMQPCRTLCYPVALATEPEIPLPDIPPFQLPDTMKATNTQLATILLPVATNSICAMIQPNDKLPIILCSAVEFWYHAKAADTTIYLCVFKQQDDTPSPQNRDNFADNTPSPQNRDNFADYVRGYALR